MGAVDRAEPLRQSRRLGGRAALTHEHQLHRPSAKRCDPGGIRVYLGGQYTLAATSETRARLVLQIRVESEQVTESRAAVAIAIQPGLSFSFFLLCCFVACNCWTIVQGLLLTRRHFFQPCPPVVGERNPPLQQRLTARAVKAVTSAEGCSSGFYSTVLAAASTISKET